MATYIFVYDEQVPELQKREDTEQQLRQEFKTKHSKAVNLEVYKQQLKDIERSFGALLRQLPGKTEVPNLLVDISQTGLSAGLRREAVPAAGRAEEGLLRGAAHQDHPHRQLPPVRRVCERHRRAAAHRDVA